jgi:predicted RNA-binding protein with PUA-like domain
VRNYQARNMLRDQVKVGDEVLIYHSSCALIGVAGTARVIRAAYADPSQFDPASVYFDAASTVQQPRWCAVDVRHQRTFAELIPLAAIKANPALAAMPLVQKGNRLSVMPVSAAQWRVILAMAPR